MRSDSSLATRSRRPPTTVAGLGFGFEVSRIRDVPHETIGRLRPKWVQGCGNQVLPPRLASGFRVDGLGWFWGLGLGFQRFVTFHSIA
jgi:hypothetical protein